MKWWQKNNMRMIQNNLRETDANMDVERLINQAEALGANAIMLNAGGVVAFYPTELKYHYKSPWLENDLIGDAVRICHEKGIRFFARFDFSKVHESIYPNKPEWFYVSPSGKNINYNGMVHTCINSYYQQVYSLKIIDEVLGRYPVDGMYFNMFGFVRKDYSNNYLGICQCDNCQKKFYAAHGLMLPLAEDDKDPAYQKYVGFKETIISETWSKIRTLADKYSVDKHIPLSTYGINSNIDIVRPESNTEIHRINPLWQYSASENCKSVEDTWDDKIVSNISMNAIGLDYRFMGVSKAQTLTRLYQNLAAGSGLDFCIIGTFDGYPDRANFEAVKEVYHFHKNNERYYGQLRSLAEVLLIKPGRAASDEYAGFFKMLKEEHIQFDATILSGLAGRLKRGHQYKAIIIPDIPDLTQEQLALLKNAAASGATVLATNLTMTGGDGNDGNARYLSELFGATFVQRAWDARWSYLDVSEDREIFKGAPETDWLFLDGNFAQVEYENDVKRYARFLRAGRFGPPERCGGNDKTDRFAVAVNAIGHGFGIHMPWQPGWMYKKYGYEIHKQLVTDILAYFSKSKWNLETTAPCNVEISFSGLDNPGTEEEGYILQLVNLSGFNGATFFHPNDVHGIKIRLKDRCNITSAQSLTSQNAVKCETQETDTVVCIPVLKTYEAIILTSSGD